MISHLYISHTIGDLDDLPSNICSKEGRAVLWLEKEVVASDLPVDRVESCRPKLRLLQVFENQGQTKGAPALLQHFELLLQLTKSIPRTIFMSNDRNNCQAHVAQQICADTWLAVYRALESSTRPHPCFPHPCRCLVSNPMPQNAHQMSHRGPMHGTRLEQASSRQHLLHDLQG
jgi:hypothetical protein